MKKVVSVLCAKPDARLHLAIRETGLGTSVFTLCLERWRDYEPAREGCEFCRTCITKWKDSIQLEEHGSEAH